MALSAEFRTPAPEKIPPKILAAAKRVPVGEYLQLRYQFNRGRLSKEEYRQIKDGATAIMYDAAKSDNRPYDPGDKIKCSADPRVGWARRKLTNVPLAEYLAASHQVLDTEIASITRQRNEYEAAGIYINEQEKANNRLHNLGVDLELTKKVAAAAGIKIGA